MSNFTNAPALLEALEQLDRLRADPELMELDRQRRLALATQACINRGIAEARAKTIIRVLGIKFNEVPQEVQMKLLYIWDIEKLDRLANAALDCHSLEEFVSHLS